ncbi:MAG: hypothetical protein P4L85_00065 [Paludisphaera borealis]|uniref:hypothetical protein n=1 Tax=Paludisphaera borealis TaxID=1387353 RepID=UPI002847CE6B|nr:hypothetical protein [Paludisphaera borealis]MDR3617718.1 hypothetical protein [Paludisphaera borealis]
MATKPTRQQVEACDQFAEALVLLTQAARLDGKGKLDRGDLSEIASRLAQASPAFGLDGIVARAMERRGRLLGLPSSTVELLTLVEDVKPLDALLLTDEDFRELVERVNEELGEV